MQALLKSALIATLFGSSLSAANLFPLREGNSWTYREARSGQTFTVEVGAKVTVNGQTYHSLTGYVSQQVYVRLDDQNRLIYVDQDSGHEAVLTSFVPAEVGWWDAPLRVCVQQGQTLHKRGTHDGAIGVVNDVLELRYRTFTCADAGVESEQYAENIGMLRRVEESIAGPRQYDLIHAKVGEIVIDALAHAQFSISIDDRSRPGSLMATLRLQTNSILPLKLQFASGQEYDLVLRASDGRVIWKWSADQIFTQSLHQRTVNGEWSMTVAVPRPPAAPEAAPGTYTLQAWLTTMGDPPQFAATIPLAIGQ